MKHRIIRNLSSMALVVMFSTLPGVARGNGEREMTLLSSIDLQIPYGQSVYDLNLGSSVTTDGIYITYGQTTACPEAPSISVSIGESGQAGLTPLSQDQTKIYRWLGGRSGTITRVHLNFELLRYTYVTCNFEISAVVTSNPPHTDRFIGVLHYNGGFVERLPLDLAPVFVRQFRVDIPSFCQGVEILEAGTRTEGVFDLASATDDLAHTYHVNGGSGARISQIAVSFNGPPNQSCDVPVYIGQAGDLD